MKIAVRGGHNFLSTGSIGLIDEVVEDRKVKDTFIQIMKQRGHAVLDVTPRDCDVNSDLAYGVSQANKWGADLFLSIHFNNAYKQYNGAIGTETWVFPNSSSVAIAGKITSNISKLGFRNRGVKTSTSMYELKHTKMKAIVVEVCFVEATEDIAIYNKVGINAIAKAIADSI